MENENSVTTEQTNDEATTSHIEDLKKKQGQNIEVETDKITNREAEENGTDHATNGVDHTGNGEVDTEMNQEEQIDSKESDSIEQKIEKVNGESSEKTQEPNSDVEQPTISLSQINLNDELPASKSTEFTYTTFGEVQVESSDESAQVNSDKPKETIEDKEIIIEPVSAELPKVEAETKSALPEKIEARTSIDSNQNQLEIDEFINKVKQNSVSNKDVCNYMLNLLVSGEFDLEKNFVIQNVKSILHLIQVIKCAQPSLKVNFFFLNLH